jgi:hypothetical protein
MKRQTVLGALFIALGIVVVAAAIIPAFAHPPQALALWPLIAGLVVAVVGGWLIPSSNVGQTFTQIFVTLGNTSLPFVGGRRASDPPTPPNGETK